MTLRAGTDTGSKIRSSPFELAVVPPPDRWEDWTELE